MSEQEFDRQDNDDVVGLNTETLQEAALQVSQNNNQVNGQTNNQADSQTDSQIDSRAVSQTDSQIDSRAESQSDSDRSGKPLRFLREVMESVIVAVVLAVLIKVFLFQNFIIPSGSMEPTLDIGDAIYINKLAYKFSQPQRTDIIVFKYPVDPKRDFVKRVIGLPGETVQVKNNSVLIDGKPIAQPFLPKGLTYPDYGPVKVPQNEYFMMGDNRPNSSDSRVWGTLPRGNILGKAMFIYWPLNRIRLLH